MAVNNGFVNDEGIRMDSKAKTEANIHGKVDSYRKTYAISSRNVLVIVVILLIFVAFSSFTTNLVVFSGVSRIENTLLHVEMMDMKERETINDYSYSEQAFWFQNYAVCSGNQQSPISIITEFTEARNTSSISVYEPEVVSVTVKNNGHTYMVIPHPAPSFSSGTLGSKNYTLAQMHFHWKSEHWVDRKQYILELHLVTYSSSYPDLTSALGNKAAAVFGLLFEECTACENRAYDKMFSVIDKVIEAGEEIKLTGDELKSFWTTGFYENMIDSYAKEWYHYNGSLTTPPCTEGIDWNVFRGRTKVPATYIKRLQTLKEKNGALMIWDYRMPQLLQYRTVELMKSNK